MKGYDVEGRVFGSYGDALVVVVVVVVVVEVKV